MTECKLQEKETSKKVARDRCQKRSISKVQKETTHPLQSLHLKGRANKLHNLLSRDKEQKQQRNDFSFKKKGKTVNLYSRESAQFCLMGRDQQMAFAPQSLPVLSWVKTLNWKEVFIPFPMKVKTFIPKKVSIIFSGNVECRCLHITVPYYITSIQSNIPECNLPVCFWTAAAQADLLVILRSHSHNHNQCMLQDIICLGQPFMFPNHWVFAKQARKQPTEIWNMIITS